MRVSRRVNTHTHIHTRVCVNAQQGGGGEGAAANQACRHVFKALHYESVAQIHAKVPGISSRHAPPFGPPTETHSFPRPLFAE